MFRSSSFLRLHLSKRLGLWVYSFYLLYQKRFAKQLPLYNCEVIAVINRLPANAVCVDIGVNETQLFTYMCKHCQQGTVIGFEPIPRLYWFLTKKFPEKMCAYIGQSLLLCWYFLMSSPEPLPIEKLKMKITTKADRYSSA